MNIPKGKYLGSLCRRGHDWNGTGKSLRYNSRGCCECVKIRQKGYSGEYRKNHKDERKEQARKYYQNNIIKIKEQRKKFYQNNKIGIRKRHKIYNTTHRLKANERLRLRIKTDLNFKVRTRMSTLIYQSVKNNKRGRRWETLVGYTVYELRRYLEKQFRDGMSWENYGKYGWHIDHIIPIAAFNFSSPEHIDFKRCWALSNLQPLWAKDNMLKNDKLIEDFQPSLAL